ncbi:MAG TPA: L,D-transpeptidase [Bauldia sp.]|nr:L,D-transpeptidase [Bauldia sp.]
MWKTLTILAAALIFGFATPGKADFSPFSLLPFGSAQPAVIAKVSLARQVMEVKVISGSGEPRVYLWKVSTGRTGFPTPMGSYRPFWLDINHKSNQYEDAPMPYAVFFNGGYAVHGTDAVARLGRPASHGCVRLSTANAAAFYNLVRTYGKWNTRILITD